MITSLESVVISNNQVVFDGETAWNEVTDRGCLAILDTEVHLNQTKYFNNSLSAIYGQGSDLHFHGVNIVRNNTGVCGGALSVVKVVSCTFIQELRSTSLRIQDSNMEEEYVWTMVL